MLSAALLPCCTLKGRPERPYPQSTVQRAHAIIEKAIGGPLANDDDRKIAEGDIAKATRPDPKTKE